MTTIETVLLTLGCLLAGFLLLQGPVLLFSNVQRMRYRAREHQLALRAWRTRLSAAELLLQDARAKQMSWAGWRKFEVLRKCVENQTGDICSFYLQPHDRKPLPGFKPGQFVMVRAEIPDPDEPGQFIEESRCYSLSDAPARGHYRLSIRRIGPAGEQPGGVVSTYMHQLLQAGDLIDISAPDGEFFLDLAYETPVVLLSAGVGVTPILSMLKALAAQGSTREVWVFFGARNTQDAVFLDEMAAACEALDRARLVICFSRQASAPAPGSLKVIYRNGRVDIGQLKTILPGSNYDYYICGPGAMMRELHEGLRAWGVPDRRVHCEAFAPEDDVAEPAVAAPAAGAFEVTFTAAKKACTWQGEKSIFALARGNKIRTDRIKYSCRQGKCGSCLTAIKDGQVAYPGVQPSFDGLEDGYCLPCICVPAGNLTLDA